MVRLEKGRLPMSHETCDRCDKPLRLCTCGAEQKDTLAELRRLAEAATPGEWRANLIKCQVETAGRDTIAQTFGLRVTRDAQFIASADPATVLNLLDVVEAAKGVLALLQGELGGTSHEVDTLVVALAALEGDEGRGGR